MTFSTQVIKNSDIGTEKTGFLPEEKACFLVILLNWSFPGLQPPPGWGLFCEFPGCA